MELCHICTNEYPVGDEKIWKVLHECSHKCCKPCFCRLKMKQWSFFEENIPGPINVLRTKCPFCRQLVSCFPQSEASNPSAKIKTLMELAKPVLSQPHPHYGDLNAICGVDIQYRKIDSEPGFKIIGVIPQSIIGDEWHVERMDGEGIIQFMERTLGIGDDPSPLSPGLVRLLETFGSIFDPPTYNADADDQDYPDPE